MSEFSVISPIDGEECLHKEYADMATIASALHAATVSRSMWANLSIEERSEKVLAVIDWMSNHRERLAEVITRSMGRPITQTFKDVDRFVERSKCLVGQAHQIQPEEQDTGADDESEHIYRQITAEPLGTVFIMATWNFPLLTVAYSLIPALIAGNTIILKHSSQTPAIADLFQQAFDEVGFPTGVFQSLHIAHEHIAMVLQSPSIDYLAFTGQEETAKLVQKMVAQRYLPAHYELGSHDPAYVREDANIDATVAALVDGAFYNVGQSPAAVKRIFVDHEVYEEFVQLFVAATRELTLGDPMDPMNNIGPLVSVAAATKVREQIQQALDQGATALLQESDFPSSVAGTAYLAPQILVNVTPEMAIMQEECYGPVVSVMPVNSTEEAVALMNQTRFGMTASIWTKSKDKAEKIGHQLQTGTVYMNCCDWRDPYLIWNGVKNSAGGATDSIYKRYVRFKAFYFRQRNDSF